MQYAAFCLAICVILVCNMRHITLQYASYQAPICHLWHPKRWLLRLRSIFSGCRKCLFTTFSLVEWRKMLMVFCQNNSHFFLSRVTTHQLFFFSRIGELENYFAIAFQTISPLAANNSKNSLLNPRNSLIQVPHVLKGDNECHFVTEISQIYSNLTNLLMSFNISERKDAKTQRLNNRCSQVSAKPICKRIC